HQFLIAQDGQALHGTLHRAHMPHCLDDVARARFALGADHGCALTDTPQGLTQVARPTHKRHLEDELIDMMRLVRWGEHFTFINIIDPQRLQNLGLSKMPNTYFGHHGNGHSLDNFFDLGWVGHACYATLGANIGWDSVQDLTPNPASRFA